MASVADAIETLVPTQLDRFDGRFEIIGQRVVEKPPMGVLESTLASLLLELMGPYARTMKLGHAFSSQASAGQKLYLKTGYGDITILKVSTPKIPAVSTK